MSRAIPAAALDLIRGFEGCDLDPYHDPVGFPTIGYGHLLSRERWADLSQFPSITQEHADRLLLGDAMKAGMSVERLIDAPLTDPQYSALVDFVFNLGAGNLQVSTLRRMINRGDYRGAADEFTKWRFAGKRELAGLLRRRVAERELYLSGTV